MLKLSLFIVTAFYQLTLAQFVVYTAKNASDEDVFWKTTTGLSPASHRISDSLDLYSAYPGKHKGPITTSHNGTYFIFQSERFDNKIDGYEAITLCKSDFTGFEVPKDETGAAFHSEGIMQITNDGKTIYFVQQGAQHSRDIFKTTKGAASWSKPEPLTSGSAFNYNIAPYLSYDESKLLFEASNSVSNSTAILEISINGTGLQTKASTAAINASVQIKSPCYDIQGNVYFETETDAERIWKLSVNGGTPMAVLAAFSNDNSPITLPDGKIISLFLPASTHQIKVMDGTGLNDRMLTQTSASTGFTEVLDIGMSAGGTSGTRILWNKPEKEGVQNRKIKGQGGIQFYLNDKTLDSKIFNIAGRQAVDTQNP